LTRGSLIKKKSQIVRGYPDKKKIKRAGIKSKSYLTQQSKKGKALRGAITSAKREEKKKSQGGGLVSGGPHLKKGSQTGRKRQPSAEPPLFRGKDESATKRMNRPRPLRRKRGEKRTKKCSRKRTPSIVRADKGEFIFSIREKRGSKKKKKKKLVLGNGAQDQGEKVQKRLYSRIGSKEESTKGPKKLHGGCLPRRKAQGASLRKGLLKHGKKKKKKRIPAKNAQEKSRKPKKKD